MGNLVANVRYAVRLLIKKPGFAAVAILTLALGVGATTAIFTVVHAVLLRPLPFPEADRLVAVRIVGRIRLFIDRVTKALPETRIVFVSVNRAPEKRDRWDVVDDINGQMRKYAERNPRVQFVDVNPALANADGSPRMELFMNDQLHLRPPAYEAFAKILKPVLERVFVERPS